MVSFSLWGSKEPTTPAPALAPAAPAPAPAPAPAVPATSKPEPVTAPLTPASSPPTTPTAPQPAADHQPSSSASASLSEESPPYPDIFSPRSLKQLGLFFGGATFLSLTVLATRRAAAKHMKASALKFYQPTHGGARHGQAIKPGERDPMLAFQALKLATIGTISFGIMGVGGIAWAFDISNIEELRTKARRGMYGTNGKVDAEAEKEVAEWLTKFLDPKMLEGATKTDGSLEKPDEEATKS